MAKSERIGISWVSRWNLVEFFDTYVQSSIYPLERLTGVMRLLLNIKIEFYYILEVDLGLYNALVYDCGYDPNATLKSPYLLLRRHSLDQSIIVKSRILWERIMNAIYYLEEGVQLEDKVSGRRSKKGVFFRFVKDHPCWRFLEPYEARLEQYDSQFRTPEVHKHSVLVTELIGARTIELNDLLDLHNRALNNVWENLISIVGGGKTVSFSDLHFGADGFIDPKFLE